ncbi:helix-turn-helix domain-containing protein [Bradyrhizobium sp. SZCCHNR2023]|uniref:helix-turn-helix domain-containing protein n=1 Tax=Bradyrhizobium sp. SZCCHNR2023 TaxID=3057380 RepID=UPI002916F46F|nr:helix-turn-helix domain-containing protein [Bradyrhizobium sp. SZCCHNR2023]
MNGPGMPTTTISATQCAAARALLGWTQDELARNAQVARATIASFEGKARIEPMRRNLLAIIASFEAAGVAFVQEDVEKGLGAGVRHRKLELEHKTDVRDDGHRMFLSVRFKGQECTVIIPREIIDDLDNDHDRSLSGRKDVIQNAFPLVLTAIEETLRDLRPVPSRMTLTHAAFPPGTF